MVGIVLISHSQKAAEGAVELARMMALMRLLRLPADWKTAVWERALKRLWRLWKTSTRVMASPASWIWAARHDGGNGRRKLEDRKIQLLDCPFVEGAVIAAIEAAGGTPLAAMQDKVEASRDRKL